MDDEVGDARDLVGTVAAPTGASTQISVLQRPTAPPPTISRAVRFWTHDSPLGHAAGCDRADPDGRAIAPGLGAE